MLASLLAIRPGGAAAREGLVVGPFEEKRWSIHEHQERRHDRNFHGGLLAGGGLAQPVAPVAQFACGKATLRGVDQMDCGEPTGAGQHQRITKFYR
jgi:hypothetical protein